MRICFLDLASGASGDMLLAALAHAGRRSSPGVEEAIKDAVASLGIGCSVTFERALRGGLHCLTATVHEPADRFDVDGLRAAIGRARLSDGARAIALAALDAIVGAEARVHGTDTGHVHLHDMGSADTAADLVGAAAGLEALGVERLCAAPVPAPRGWVDTEAGALPLPSPATLELLRGAPMYGTPDEVELVTPTAAALLVAHGATFGPMPPLVVEEIGVGGGRRELSRPNVCRLIVGTLAEDAEAARAVPAASAYPARATLERDVLLECNIDDQAPEALGHALDALMSSGVHDAWITPIVMKKSRPAYLLSVLCDPADEGSALDVIFRQTTTLGVRRREVAKWALRRDVLQVPVRGANLRVKVGRIGEEVVTVSPEFDDCSHLAGRTGASLKDIYAEASEKARRLLER